MSKLADVSESLTCWKPVLYPQCFAKSGAGCAASVTHCVCAVKGKKKHFHFWHLLDCRCLAGADSLQVACCGDTVVAAVATCSPRGCRATRVHPSASVAACVSREPAVGEVQNACVCISAWKNLRGNVLVLSLGTTRQ